MKNKYSKQRKLMIALSVFLSYIVAETIIASSRFFDYISIAKDYATFLNGYKMEHNFFFHMQKPDSELGFVYATSTDEQRRREEYLSGEKDELGFKNLPGDKENGKIVVIGDSFSYGLGVSISESWSKRLESYLGINVSNFSVEGYKPVQYNRIMKKYSQYLKDRIILYGLYTNDFTDKTDMPIDSYESSGRNKFKSPKPSFFDLIALQKKPFYERTLIHSLYRWLYLNESKNIMNTKGNEVLRIGDNAAFNKECGGLLVRGESEIKEKWLSEENKARFFKTLKMASDTAEEYNSKLVVVYFPSRAYIYSKEYISGFSDEKPIKLEEQAKRMLNEYVTALDLPFIDLTTTLSREYEQGIPVYLFKDVHFNPRGNEIAAQEIACTLIDWGYVEPTKTTTKICKHATTN